MSISIGRLVALLADHNDNDIPSRMSDLINQNVRPPVAVAADDVHVRAMYIVSDAVNSFGGRFPADEHPRLTQLLIDSPVLVGHRKDCLPIGRNFHAEVVEKDGRSWVKSFFYWLRAARGADDLRENIDRGVYKECSIAFTFQFPECSICGRDIRTCEHHPMETYDRDGAPEVCHFNYRQIERVLETSLVYRGAVPGTTITTADSLHAVDVPVLPALDAPPLVRLSQFDPRRTYIVTPAYDGAPVTAAFDGSRLSLTSGSVALESSLAVRFDTGGLAPFDDTPGVLIGFRGKERCSEAHLHRHLAGLSSPVTRLELRLLIDNDSLRLLEPADPRARCQLRRWPSSRGTVADLIAAARKLATRDGSFVWVDRAVRRFTPSTDTVAACWLLCDSAGANCWLAVAADHNLRWFRLKDTPGESHVLPMLSAAHEHDEAPPADLAEASCIAAADGRLVTAANSGFGMRLDPPLAGELTLRPAKLGGRRAFLMRWIPSTATNGSNR